MRILMSRAVVLVLLVALLATVSAAQLSGAYTIDPNGTGAKNYKTFAAAMSALGAGVSGSVTFTVASTTFKESVSVPAVPTASATNVITFIAVGTPAIIDANGAADGLKLNMDAKFTNFENLEIRNFTTNGLYVDGKYQSPTWHRVTDCKFKKLKVVGPTNSTRLRTLNINQCYDLTFEDCIFEGSYYTLYSQGMYRAIFDRCEFDGKGYAYRVLAPYNANDADCLFRNCFIHDCAASGYVAYIDLSHFGTMFWHNVFIGKTSREVVRYGGCCGWSRANSFRNNIVINHGSGPALTYGFYNSTTRPVGLDYNDADYNCYFAPNTTVGTVQLQTNSAGFAYAGSLAGWKAYLAKNKAMIFPLGGGTYDQNSIEGNPGLVSMVAPYDLHLSGASPCIDAGTTKLKEGSWITYPPTAKPTMPATVPTDFEGETRPALVDIGADEVGIKIVGSGSGQIGTTLSFALTASSDAGLPYQVGSSLGNGPVKLGNRQLDLTPDQLLIDSTSGKLPTVFGKYSGLLDAQAGTATANFNIPKIGGLKGIRIFTAFVTIKAGAPFNIQSISNPFMFTIQ